MPEFFIEKKIYYHDTDCGGVVYYANYLKYLEEGRAEFCASRGINLSECIAKGVEFPVVHIEVDYKAPARYADIIRIFTRVEKIGNSSIHFLQEIKKDTLTLVIAKTVWACVNKELKVQPVPGEVKKALLSS